MAISFDSSSSGNSAGTSSYSYNHTCTGSNLYLFVATTTNATAVTYNSVSLTLLRTYTPSFPPGTLCPAIKVWGLANPSTGGAYSITVTSGADVSVAASYSGVAPVATENYVEEDSANNNVSSLSSTVTTLTPNAWHIGFFIGFDNSTNTFSAGTGTTHRVSRYSFATAKAIGILDTGSAVSTPASNAIVCNWTGGTGKMSVYGISMPPVFVSAGSFLQYF